MKCHFFFQIKQFQYTLNNKFSITMQASNNTILQSTNKDSIFGLPCVYFIHHVIYISRISSIFNTKQEESNNP